MGIESTILDQQAEAALALALYKEFKGLYIDILLSAPRNTRSTIDKPAPSASRITVNCVNLRGNRYF